VTPHPSPCGFQGDLRALSVIEIVQTINLAGRTARVVLRTSSGTGEMWFENGSITHAFTESLFGELAVYAMIEWTSGRFLVEYGRVCGSRSVTGDTRQLLLDGCRLIDERSSASATGERSLEVQPAAARDLPGRYWVRLSLGVAGLALIVVAVTFAGIHFADLRLAPPAEAAPLLVPKPHSASPSGHKSNRESPSARHGATARPQRPDGASAAASPLPAAAPASPLAEGPVPYTEPR
jgi:hypothetical protein